MFISEETAEGLDPVRRRRLPEDDADGAPAPPVHEHCLAGGDVAERGRDDVRPRPGTGPAGRVDGYLNVSRNRARPARPARGVRPADLTAHAGA